MSTRKKKRNAMNPARRAFAFAALLQRDGDKCAICQGAFVEDGQEGPLSRTLDHIIPYAKGGSSRVGNLQLAHRKCNASKRDSLPTAKAKKDFDACLSWNGRSYPLPEIRDHLPFADAAVLRGMSLQLVSTLVKTGKVRGNSIHKTVSLDSLDAYLETRDQPKRRSA